MKLAHLTTLSASCYYDIILACLWVFLWCDLDIHLRHYYKNNTFKNIDTTSHGYKEDPRSQRAQTFRMDFSYGYFS